MADTPASSGGGLLQMAHPHPGLVLPGVPSTDDTGCWQFIQDPPSFYNSLLVKSKGYLWYLACALVR